MRRESSSVRTVTIKEDGDVTGYTRHVVAEGVGPKGSITLYRWHVLAHNGRPLPDSRNRGFSIEHRDRQGLHLWTIDTNDHFKAIALLCRYAAGESLPNEWNEEHGR